MQTYARVMEKWEFVELAAQLVKENRNPGYLNSELRMKLSDFKNWDDWFGFGEWDDGPHTIYAPMAEDNKCGIDFLKKNGFKTVK